MLLEFERKRTGLEICKFQQLPGERSRGKVKEMNLAMEVVNPKHGERRCFREIESLEHQKKHSLAFVSIQMKEENEL